MPNLEQLPFPQGARRDALALAYPDLDQFDDPTLEWRRLFSELFGTFMLVLVAAGGGMLHAEASDQVSLAAAVVAPGLMVMAIILFMGSVSGAHLNPAVSIAFALRRDFAWRRVPGYIAVQLIGATLACLFLRAVLGDVGGLGATEPGAGYEAWQAMLIEMVLTLGLVSTILGTASGAQNVGSIGVHASLGFHMVGTLRAVGVKFGRWVDVVSMQRALGRGDANVPD